MAFDPNQNLNRIRESFETSPEVLEPALPVTRTRPMRYKATGPLTDCTSMQALTGEISLEGREAKILPLFPERPGSSS